MKKTKVGNGRLFVGLHVMFTLEPCQSLVLDRRSRENSFLGKAVEYNMFYLCNDFAIHILSYLSCN